VASAVNSGSRETVDELIRRIGSGETVLAGGYELTNALVTPLMSADLAQLVSKSLGSIHAIEVTRVEEKCGNYSQRLGELCLSGVRHPGEPYWSSTETVCDMSVVSGSAELLGD
jgi:hypothetical protein